jgi:hypothetical protein
VRVQGGKPETIAENLGAIVAALVAWLIAAVVLAWVAGFIPQVAGALTFSQRVAAAVLIRGLLKHDPSPTP